jgi:hypothetical protein
MGQGVGAHTFSRRPARPVDEGIRLMDTGVHMVSIGQENRANQTYSM